MMSYELYLLAGGIVALVLLVIYANYKAKKMEEELDRIVEEEKEEVETNE